MLPSKHAQIGHFRAPIYLDIGSASLLLNVNIIKQGHTTLIPEENQLDHDNVGLLVQLKDNIVQTVQVCSIRLSVSVDRST